MFPYIGRCFILLGFVLPVFVFSVPCIVYVAYFVYVLFVCECLAYARVLFFVCLLWDVCFLCLVVSLDLRVSRRVFVSNCMCLVHCVFIWIVGFSFIWCLAMNGVPSVLGLFFIWVCSVHIYLFACLFRSLCVYLKLHSFLYRLYVACMFL